MRLPIGSALSVAQGIVDQLVPSREVPTAEEGIAAVHGFEQVKFDTPIRADSDGFLFQYGEVNWFSESTFTVGFVRQMELVDANGDCEGYSQVQFEYRYRVDADLRALESRNSWWFYGGGVPFEEWLDSVRKDPVGRLFERRVR